MAPRKAWRDLTPAYRKRMTAHGLNARNWNTKKGDTLRQAARGHKETPERPAQAARSPQRFQAYSQRRSNELAALRARKAQLFGNRIKYRARASDRNTITNPAPGTGGKINREYVRRFLRMTEAEVDSIDWSDHEWGFLFYH